MAPLWFEEWQALWILIVQATVLCQKHGQKVVSGIFKKIPLFYLITIITSRLDEQQKLLRQRTACTWKQKLVNMLSVQI